MPSRRRPFRAPSPLTWYMKPGRVFHLPSSGNTREAPANQKTRSMGTKDSEKHHLLQQAQGTLRLVAVNTIRYLLHITTSPTAVQERTRPPANIACTIGRPAAHSIQHQHVKRHHLQQSKAHSKEGSTASKTGKRA